eukprot:TRINITY_DN90390_c0_g1_i1.p1 TRINITY_DN90390_c0_g1~~TRINITY_DN90390_c0_g1_i1.p1  ORF type:complete len:179 (-),score=15.87 TRINITY_DN90390_c0_g1_i1:86-622(-)
MDNPHAYGKERLLYERFLSSVPRSGSARVKLRHYALTGEGGKSPKQESRRTTSMGKFFSGASPRGTRQSEVSARFFREVAGEPHLQGALFHGAPSLSARSTDARSTLSGSFGMSAPLKEATLGQTPRPQTPRSSTPSPAELRQQMSWLSSPRAGKALNDWSPAIVGEVREPSWAKHPV